MDDPSICRLLLRKCTHSDVPENWRTTPCGTLDPDYEICVLISAQRAHIGTKDALNNEVKLAFGQGNLFWKPGHLRSAYAGVCCHRFKPKNMTDDIFLAEILGHKLLPGAAALSVGQSYKDFYVKQ